jgi:hypothetical protein
MSTALEYLPLLIKSVYINISSRFALTSEFTDLFNKP